MRLSVDQKDPGYNIPLATIATVLFNGNPIRWARTADEEAGEVIRYVVDSQEGLVLDDAGNPVMETVHGRVTLVFVRRD